MGSEIYRLNNNIINRKKVKIFNFSEYIKFFLSLITLKNNYILSIFIKNL